jgi:hypothetical protein
MTVSVHGLCLSSRAKESGYLWIAFLVRLGSEGQIFPVCLRFSCKSFLQKLFGFCHFYLPPRYNEFI